MAKGTVQIQQRYYDTREVLGRRYGVVPKTISDWARRGILPKPLRLGRVKYYGRVEVENRLMKLT